MQTVNLSLLRKYMTTAREYVASCKFTIRYDYTHSHTEILSLLHRE